MDEHGLSVFNVLRWRLRDHEAVLCAFDLIAVDDEDLRWRPLEVRKATLAKQGRIGGPSGWLCHHDPVEAPARHRLPCRPDRFFT